MQTMYVSWPISPCHLFKKSLSAAMSQHSIVWYSGSPRKDIMPESYVKAWMESEKCDFKILQSFLSWKQENCMCCDFKDSLCHHRRDDIKQCMAVSLVLVHHFLCSFNHDGKMKWPHTCMRGFPRNLHWRLSLDEETHSPFGLHSPQNSAPSDVLKNWMHGLHPWQAIRWSGKHETCQRMVLRNKSTLETREEKNSITKCICQIFSHSWMLNSAVPQESHSS